MHVFYFGHLEQQISCGLFCQRKLAIMSEIGLDLEVPIDQAASCGSPLFFRHINSKTPFITLRNEMCLALWPWGLFDVYYITYIACKGLQ